MAHEALLDSASKFERREIRGKSRLEKNENEWMTVAVTSLIT